MWFVIESVPLWCPLSLSERLPYTIVNFPVLLLYKHYTETPGGFIRTFGLTTIGLSFHIKSSSFLPLPLSPSYPRLLLFHYPLFNHSLNDHFNYSYPQPVCVFVCANAAKWIDGDGSLFRALLINARGIAAKHFSLFIYEMSTSLLNIHMRASSLRSSHSTLSFTLCFALELL